MNMKIQWSLIIGLFLALVIAVFAVLNVDKVTVDFAVSEANIPLILLILGCTFFGGLMVGLYGIIQQLQLHRKLRDLQVELAELRKHVPEEMKLSLDEDKHFQRDTSSIQH